jgi:hypothetical protein
VTVDTELENWRHEWRDRPEPLPELKRKIRRQNQRTAAAIVAVVVCLVISTVVALRTHNSFMNGLAVGIAFAGVLLGGYGWWVRRGAWKPTAQSTVAYADLSYKRAVARSRTLRFSFYFLLTATVLFVAFIAWNWTHFAARDGVVAVAMAVEVCFLKRSELRKKQEVEQAKKLLDNFNE